MNKTNKISLILIASILIIMLITFAANKRKQEAAPSNDSMYSLTKTDKTDITDLTRTFLTTAGDFGVNYDTLPLNDYSDLYSAYSSYSISDVPIPSTLTGYVTTRSQAYDKLISSTKSKQSIILTSSDLGSMSNEDLLSSSDASFLSSFIIKPDSIRISKPADSVVSLTSDGDPILTLDASWTSVVTKLTEMPGDRGMGKTQSVKWNHDSNEVTITGARISVVKNGGKWYVAGVSGTGDGTFNGKPWVLAPSKNSTY